MRLTLATLQSEAEKRNLILEKIGHRYDITDNSQSVTETCDTLEEAWSAIYYWDTNSFELEEADDLNLKEIPLSE